MNFSMALQVLLSGGMIARQAWSPTATAPTLYMINGQIEVVNQTSIANPTPYAPIQADILASDWYQVC